MFKREFRPRRTEDRPSRPTACASAAPTPVDLHLPRAEAFTADTRRIDAARSREIWYALRSVVACLIHTTDTQGLQTCTHPRRDEARTGC